MTSPSLPVETQPSRRRWQFSRFQFSLRTLLIGVTLSAIPFAWYGQKYQQAERHKAAIAWVNKKGGSIKSVAVDKRPWWKLGGDWNEVKVKAVVFNGIEMSDLRPLKEFTHLERFVLFNNQVSDLTPLAELVNLEVLNLMYNEVRDLSPLQAITFEIGELFQWC